MNSHEIEKALFEAARGFDDAETQRAFLEQTCRENDALRTRIERLLTVESEAADFFSVAPVLVPEEAESGNGTQDNASEPARSSAETAPAMVDRYRLLERLGEGGCGVVYLAEQLTPVSRKVALKVIRLGMDTERVIARFELERQALALMNHPNIAQVLDAGATESGRPYFVMELVRGIKITEYCEERSLDIRSRLGLFVQLCLAIQHAHQKGILHRDIKPSNVLVAEEEPGQIGIPKVIDFGIAKAIEGHPATATVSVRGQFIGTPAYMSPEQAGINPHDIDTRSDIYSLGAVFYELLTGRPPFDSEQLANAAPDEMRRILQNHEPLPPSRLLNSIGQNELEAIAVRRQSDPSKLLATLRGDLDWIVMKALEKDRQRRYASASGLAADVERYLNNEPVSARPPSRIYRLQKLVRRNRATFASIAAVSVALIAGLSTSTWLFFKEREVRRQQALLLAEAEKNEKITRAAFLAREGKPGEANALLEQIYSLPQRPSLDGVSAFRAVGDWLALQQKWQEATRRFAFVMHLDELDFWGSVTIDYQAYAVLLVETGDLSTYAHFCRASAARYSKETNGDAASRILKSCLLRPPDAALSTLLQPLAKAAENAFPKSGSKPWAAIPVSLWRYRCGDYRSAAEVALPKEGQSDTSAATATNCAILAMALFHEGKVEEARGNVARAQKIVDAGFARLNVGNGSQGYWFDWLFARELLREATAMIEGNGSQGKATEELQKVR